MASAERSSDAELRTWSSASAQDLSAALKAYETDFGAYPPPGCAQFVRALRVSFEFPMEQVSPAGELLDRWGRPCIWEHPAPGAGRLYSCGPNGRDERGKGDDVVLVDLPGATSPPAGSGAR